MKLTYTNTCKTIIQMGFAGHGGWFVFNLENTSAQKTVSLKEKWRTVTDYYRFELRTKCYGGTLTLHKVELYDSCYESAAPVVYVDAGKGYCVTGSGQAFDWCYANPDELGANTYEPTTVDRCKEMCNNENGCIAIEHEGT